MLVLACARAEEVQARENLSVEHGRGGGQHEAPLLAEDPWRSIVSGRG